MASRIRWGIIGTANIAREALIPAIKQSSNSVVLAVGSRDQQRARAYADELGIERAYGSYEALLADPDIDAIYNPLPNDGHAEWSIAAAKAGKPTLCEKPLARNADEAQQIVDAFKQYNILLAEAFMYRYHPQHAKVRELIDSGTIGKLNLIDAVFTYALPAEDRNNVRLKPELGGGGLLDVGCYCVNLCRMMAGTEPVSVTAQAMYNTYGVDDNLVGTLQFPNGILARFACGMQTLVRNEYMVSGPAGSITSEFAFRPADGGTTTLIVKRPNTASTPQEVIAIPAANQYMLMVEDFADAVANGRKQTYDPNDSVKNMRVLDALNKAARDGVVVRL